PSFGRVVYLRIRPKRFCCPFCDGHPTTTQQLDWYDPNALHTKAYERHLIVQLVNSTIADLEAKEDVTYAALLGILDRSLAKRIDWETLEPFATLGIDEIALLKGHRDFVAIISAQTDAGDLHVLAVLPDRLKATVLAGLLSMPQAIRAHITTVCTDTWEGYVTAVEDALPNAMIVLDRFHVMRHARDGVDTLRKQEVRRLKKELPKDVVAGFKHTLWPFRKRSDVLEMVEQERLETLLASSPPLRQAYALREQLSAIFDTARSKADGLRRLHLEVTLFPLLLNKPPSGKDENFNSPNSIHRDYQDTYTFSAAIC